MSAHEIHLVRVFAASKDGGNPAPIILNADRLSDNEMRSIAGEHGRESAFVLRPEDASHTFRFRFFVPNHEMEMCGHATLGALWLLRKLGVWTTKRALIETRSGVVEARIRPVTDVIEVSQPAGVVQPVDDAGLLAATLDVMNLSASDLLPVGIVNATTSRTKTLIPLKSVAQLHALRPKFERVEALCSSLNSTGLYPFAVDAEKSDALQARQFPRSSGYPEDVATGIAAAALLYGARHYGLLSGHADGVHVHQGVAMGRPSEISVEFRDSLDTARGCWISGAVQCDDPIGNQADELLRERP
ncbi:putative isomerase YddE (plasmid) [Caballeronia sp. SBC1]|uniref:PhzF family phenazine biosynthesis protein n=1 Tax=unclassified Caballeronia TaxID=2646786 RepID=UPI0013E191B2|nr:MULTISPECIES: PhzF family phenazine biosynthesis protein [unclassified Caballeronia]QIE27133.1 putative isomerase YddE [Caballeronia sp. SBC2]QIN65390.1 putative isomerase YddE [Caballeronia sp. SBC1]